MEQGFLHVTESGPPAQSILSYVLEAAGQPAGLELTTTQCPVRASASYPGPQAQPGPHAAGELNSPQGSHKLCEGSPETDIFPT